MACRAVPEPELCQSNQIQLFNTIFFPHKVSKFKGSSARRSVGQQHSRNIVNKLTPLTTDQKCAISFADSRYQTKA